MLLHNLINERIELLLNGLEEETNNADKWKVISEAEKIISKLPKEDRKIMETYINHIFDSLALKELCLYKGGFIDGVRAIKRLLEL